jgi:hypothetical protein
MGIIGNPCKMGKEEFVTRFTHNETINIIDNTDESRTLKDTLVAGRRVGPQVMQIPIQSLGVVHKVKNMFDLSGTKLSLTMADDILKEAKIFK